MKRVHRSSLTFLAFLFILKECESCSSVRASRAFKFVPKGSDLRLSCEVQHCGQAHWTGGWAFQEMQSQGFIPVTSSERIELSNYSSVVNSTHLIVHIHSINQSDAGAYKCMITWPDSITSSGHMTYVNVTAAPEDNSRRSNKVRLCLVSLVCFLVVLGLVWCLIRARSTPPPVPPHTYNSARVKLKKELVYADIKLNDSRLQNEHPRAAFQSVVYSTVDFSSA